MARTILTVSLIFLLQVLVGCNNANSGKAQLIPNRAKASRESAALVKVVQPAETDIVEQLAINRQAYRQGLERLIKYYNETGNNMKLSWAKKELAALDRMPQYNYIIEASLAGPNLKAGTEITEADNLYYEGLTLEQKAKRLVVIRDDDLLRLALDKYNELIRKYPSSDKIDDAAYRAGCIYEYFNDYSIAVLYYQRTYQWNPESTYPARYKAAYILDKKLHRRDEALELYKQALEKEKLGEIYKEFTEKRIEQLTESDKNP